MSNGAAPQFSVTANPRATCARLLGRNHLRLAADEKNATLYTTRRIDGYVKTWADGCVDLEAGAVVTEVERDGSGAWLTIDGLGEVFVAYLCSSDLVTEEEWQQRERETAIEALARELLGAYRKDWYEDPLYVLAINLAEGGIAAQLSAEAA